MQRDDNAYLIDLLTAAKFIVQFIADQNQASFIKDHKTQFACFHQLTILAEASKKLSAEFKSRHPEIAWTEIIGMRNHIVHAYHSVDLDIIWQAISHDVPSLLQALIPYEPTNCNP